MKILSTNVYVGPNTWAGFPVIRNVLDLGVLEDWPSVKLGTAFIDTLVEAGYLEGHPVDPYGGKFFLNETGQVVTTSKFAFAEARRADADALSTPPSEK